MKNEEIAAGLRDLAASDRRSRAARLRELMPEIEAALAAGVTRAAVVAELARHGLVVTLAGFDSVVRRARGGAAGARRAARGVPASPAAQAPAWGTAWGAAAGPAEVDRILGAAPDLDALSRVGKQRSR